MNTKFEIKYHDGIGRITTLHVNNKKILTPSLLNPYEIPPLHLNDTNKLNLDFQLHSKIQLDLGYLPRMHYFSSFSSGKEVLKCIKEVYSKVIRNNFDIVIVPLDPAHLRRSLTQYPQFIEKVISSIPEISFGWVYPYDDQENYWGMSKPNLIVLGDISRLVNNPRKLWDYLFNIVTKFPNTLKYAPAVPPIFMPLLTYLGIDFFDTLYGNYMAHSNTYLEWSGKYEINKLKDHSFYCQCDGCKARSDIPIESWLSKHNSFFTKAIMQNIQFSFLKDKLRDFVKQTVLIDPSLVALLRIADKKGQILLEQYNPSFKSEKLLITSFSDFSRPEVLRYQKLFLDRFRIPDWNQIVLILPCSAKKPYSESKSHRLFSKAIKTGLGGSRFIMTELIITSPLGIVPRFWEKVYPAGFYDITVTGDWIKEETEIIKKLLLKINSQIPKNVPFLAYLDNPEKAILEEIIASTSKLNIEVLQISDKETHPDSLKLLSERLKQLNNDHEYLTISKKRHLVEMFRSMADYQFGLPAGEIIFPENTTIKRRYHHLVALIDNKQIATIPNLGQLRLTINGAHRLIINSKYHGYNVTFGGDELQGSAVYTPGIIDADENIRPQDDVFVFSQTGSFIGIGKSHLSGAELVLNDYGIGVSLRKKFRN